MSYRRRFRGAYSFVIALAAAIAFIVGAMRFWGVPGSEVKSILSGALLLVGGIAVLALLTVSLIKLIQYWANR